MNIIKKKRNFISKGVDLLGCWQGGSKYNVWSIEFLMCYLLLNKNIYNPQDKADCFAKYYEKLYNLKENSQVALVPETELSTFLALGSPS